ncbi:MAG TPA: tRNA (adenosine(37)-N6)-dimethylallyltransferase MiaA, partial [Aggregatilineales bacterium]|nr:tRNA (adenosine(37)-N6)-dimethylallyltransferase MiaA [Aggregatilineales bacterium]
MWRTRLAGERPLIVILGPTAAGKTRAAIALARALDGEIIGADSRQIYRHMDIGTAKPTVTEQAAARHHLIDLVDPDQTLSVAEYQRLAYAAVADIHARGRVPLLVGGTGQYISAVIEGWSIPQVAPNDALRAELEAFAAEHGSEALHARLAAIDSDAAARIDHQNVRRVVRALEVCIETGRPISELQQKHPPPYAIVQYGVTLERSALYARADARITHMMAAGFLDEVRGLLARGYDRRLPSLSGIGYAQLAEHLLDGVPLADALEKTRTLTHDFIRRQFTW